MAAHIDLVVIITPRPGKVDRVVELLQELSEFVKKNEPDTLKYEINVEAKQGGAKEVVMLETYKDRAAIGAHVSSKENKTFQKTLRDEDLLDGSVQMKRIKTVGGFSSRL